MKDIARTFYETLIDCQIADLKTGKVINYKTRMKNKYKKFSTMETKLYNMLDKDQKRLIKINSFKIVAVTYYMKPENFRANADYNSEKDYNIVETKNNIKKRKENKNHE